MAELKTKKTKKSVSAFVRTVERSRQDDCNTIINMMSVATNSSPAMWGDAIIGFGEDHLVYASGRELDWFKIGFSPRKGKISLYCMCATKEMNALLKKLGTFKAGKGCLYIKSLEDVNVDVLQQIFNHASESTQGGCGC
jgi:hypothetical protein